MIVKRDLLHKIIAVAIAITCSVSLLVQTAMGAPAWEYTVCLKYEFATDSKFPLPDYQLNTFGEPTAQIVQGPFSRGWQSPTSEGNVVPSYGNPANGAWDLGTGPEGAIRITLPIGNLVGTEDFTAYRVRLQVGCTAYGKMYGMPQLAIERYGLQCLGYETEYAFADSHLGGWSNCTWNATLVSVRENTITLVVSGDQYWGSVVDALEIYVLAEALSEITHTGMGVPIVWYEEYGLFPLAGDTWNDVDFYDSDGDGVLNWQEYMAGSDPTNSSSAGLRITSIQMVEARVPVLQWLGSKRGSQAPYVIEGTRELRRPTWEVLGTSERRDGLNEWIGSEIEPLKCRFFRLKGENERLCPLP